MTEDTNFAKPHEIMLHLKGIVSYVQEQLDMHLNYYRGLKNIKLIRYGIALTGNSICLLLRVLSNKEFEKVISDDPALDKVYELVSIIPFINLL